MNKPTLLILFTIFNLTVFSQEKEKKVDHQQEVAITFRNIDNFGISYRIGKETALWRFQAISFDGETNNLPYDDDERDDIKKTIGFGLSIGREYRKKIHEKVEFRFGVGILANYSSYTSNPRRPQFGGLINERDEEYFELGTNLILGFNYISESNIVIGVEVLPSVKYFELFIDNSRASNYSNNGIYYEFKSSSALLSVGYRF